MKRLLMILASLLLLFVMVAANAEAGIVPRYDDGFVNGGDGGTDGPDDDHPWGGDRVIGTGDVTDRGTTTESTITGVMTLDLAFLWLAEYFGTPETITDTKITTSTKPERPTAVTSRSRVYRGSVEFRKVGR